MKHAALSLSLLVACLVCTPVNAQNTDRTNPSVDDEVSINDVQLTPEMWFYLQERRRHEDPQDAVRRKAEFRAQQRQARIAATKAAGRSKQRPSVENTIFASMFTTRHDYNWHSVWPTRIIDVYYRDLTYGEPPRDTVRSR